MSSKVLAAIARDPVIVLLFVAGIATGAYFLRPIRQRFGDPATPATLAKVELNSFKICLMAYRAMGGSYPSTAQGLLALAKPPKGEPRPKYWRQIYEGSSIKKDPWGHEYRYESPGPKHPSGYDLYSLGEDGKPGTKDDIWPD